MVNSNNNFASRWAIGAMIAGVVLFFGGFFIGTYNSNQFAGASVTNAQSLTASTTADFAPFWRAWTLLNEKFVTAGEGPTDQEKVWGAIQGLASAYGDPYTTFFPPEESKIFNEEISGSFEGVGMEVGIKDGFLTVIAPLKGNPAEKAGIKTGDVLVKINATSTQGLSTEEAIKMIRGPKGTPVNVTVARKGEKEPLEIEIIRDTIEIPTVETKTTDGIFIITVYSFSAQSADLFRQALREFVYSGSEKLIVDLRNNPGGYLDAAVDMASWFLPVGKTIVTEDFGTNSTQKPDVHRSRGYNIFPTGLKMAVLVNGGSASASEILAGALQDYKIATIVGEKTFGKGSVQQLIPVTKETSLKVTIARWLTPNGHSISKVGLTPDVIVPITAKDVEAKRDPQMEKALEILGQK